ncbi:unnamed protein product [Ectocarpus sp. 4 AP-2014]
MNPLQFHPTKYIYLSFGSPRRLHPALIWPIPVHLPAVSPPPPPSLSPSSTGTSPPPFSTHGPTELVYLLRIAARSEAIIPVPHQNKRLYAPELLNARVSNDNQQVANAEDVVAEHPLLGYVVPAQASADDAEPLTTNKAVEALQEGSGGGTDVETTGFNHNGGTFVAPLRGGSLNSAKTSEEDEAFFATGDADTKQEQHLHQHPPGWTKSFKNVFTKSSGRKLLLMAKDFEKVYAYVEDTTASTLRFGGKTPALLASLATAAAASSFVSAASTSGLSAGTTSADMSDIGSGGTTSVPGDRTDDATWTLFVCIISIGVAMVAWIVWLSPLWVLLRLLVWAESMGRSRGGGSSDSPNIQATGAVAAAPDMPERSIRRHAPRSSRSSRSPRHARRSLSHTPRSRRHASPAPPAVAPPAAGHGHGYGPAVLAAVSSTVRNTRPSHVGTPGPPAPANTGPAQPVPNAIPAPEPEPRVGRGRRAMQRLGRGISLLSIAAKVKEAAADVDMDEVVSSVREFFSDVADALGDVLAVAG